MVNENLSALQMSMNVPNPAYVCEVCVLTLSVPSPVPNVRLDTLFLMTDRGVRVSYDPVTLHVYLHFFLKSTLLKR